MSSLDDLLRTTLQDTPANDVDSHELADQLTALRAARQKAPSNRWRRRVLSAAPLAAAVAVVALIIGVVGRDTTDSSKVVADGTGEPGHPDDGTAQPSGAFAALGAGWHELPNTPVPNDFGFQAVWTGTEIIAMWAGGAASYAPGDGSWLPFDVPREMSDGLPSIGWAGDRLVAVAESASGSPANTASWDPKARSWTALGQAPTAAPITAAGIDGSASLGILAPQGNDLLVWTGKRLIDFTRGAVLKPADGTWSELPMPADLGAYPDLFPSAQGVSPNSVTAWDGKELTLRSLSQTPGLAWDDTGTSYRELPPPPAAVTTAMLGDQPDGNVGASSGAGTGNSVVYVSGTTPATVAYDSSTDAWGLLPNRPMEDQPCAQQVLSLDGAPVVQCDATNWVLLTPEGWQAVSPPPNQDSNSDPNGGMMEDRRRWLDAGGSLLRLAPSSSDGTNEPTNGAWVWVPDERTAKVDDGVPITDSDMSELAPGTSCVGQATIPADAGKPQQPLDCEGG